MGTKSSDLFVAAGCFACHDILDGRDRKGADYIEEKYPAAVAWRVIAGLYETQARFIEMGMIEVKGAEIVK